MVQMRGSRNFHQGKGRVQVSLTKSSDNDFFSPQLILQKSNGQGDLAIRRIFSLVDMSTKPKFSNCPNIFKIGLFR